MRIVTVTVTKATYTSMKVLVAFMRDLIFFWDDILGSRPFGRRYVYDVAGAAALEIRVSPPQFSYID
jgi:hypothetical protein